MSKARIEIPLQSPPEGALLEYYQAKQQGQKAGESEEDFDIRLSFPLSQALAQNNNQSDLESTLKKLHIFSLLCQMQIMRPIATFFKAAKEAQDLRKNPAISEQSQIQLAAYWLLALDFYNNLGVTLEQRLEILSVRLKVADEVSAMLQKPTYANEKWADLKRLAHKYCTPVITALPLTFEPLTSSSSSSSSSTPSPAQGTKRSLSPSLNEDNARKKKKARGKKDIEDKASAPEKKKSSTKKLAVQGQLPDFTFSFDKESLAKIIGPDALKGCKNQKQFNQLIEERLLLGIAQQVIQSSLPLPAFLKSPIQSATSLPLSTADQLESTG